MTTNRRKLVIKSIAKFSINLVIPYLFYALLANISTLNLETTWIKHDIAIVDQG